MLTFVMLDVPDFVNGLNVCEEATGIMLATVDGVPVTFETDEHRWNNEPPDFTINRQNCCQLLKIETSIFYNNVEFIDDWVYTSLNLDVNLNLGII